MRSDRLASDPQSVDLLYPFPVLAMILRAGQAGRALATSFVSASKSYVRLNKECSRTARDPSPNFSLVFVLSFGDNPLRCLRRTRHPQSHPFITIGRAE